MVLQQFGGVNAIVFYASAIFISAGKYYSDHNFFFFLFSFLFFSSLFVKKLCFVTGFSGSVGTIAMVAVQVI